MATIRALRWLTLTTVVVASGCYNLERPKWLRPGPTDYQRYNAVVHDPYPDTNAGPEALGTRPRDYATTPNDSQRYPMRHGQQ
ncbi:MAG TPA: hypothetical protein VL096_14805 [Pirellulaceae bacterium]|nr:hypothetical protein [Pirellulaceae bacterium]